jgi:hypothetical protein
MQGSFEQYLKDEFEEGKIDFSIRISQVGEDGHPVFYIHPTGKNGTTLDFVVLDNCLIGRWTSAQVGSVV